jgi:hypothetical protein
MYFLELRKYVNNSTALHQKKHRLLAVFSKWPCCGAELIDLGTTGLDYLGPFSRLDFHEIEKLLRRVLPCRLLAYSLQAPAHIRRFQHSQQFTMQF